jgi:hypothetical protein
MNDLYAYLKQHFTEFKGGGLRMFGDWFGRPHDNVHIPKKFSFDNDVLTITFDGDETLTIWNPSHVQIQERMFKIGEASKVRWEWFYYGRPKTQENRFFLEYVKDQSGIHTDTNVSWYTPPFHTSMKELAVVIE